MSHGKKRGGGKPVDMSVPPEQRRRKRRQQVVGGTPPAQQDRASGPRGRALARDGERLMETERRLREDAARFKAEFPELDGEAALDRLMARIREGDSEIARKLREVPIGNSDTGYFTSYAGGSSGD